VNISAAFRNRNVVSRTCLHRVCLLLNVELEYTLSYIQTFYQNAGGEHTSMWPLTLSYRQTNRLPSVDIPFQLVLLAWGLLHCPLLQCPPLPHRADLSTPAKSTLATWCRIVHSCIVHPCHTVPICPLLYCPLPQIQRSRHVVYCFNLLFIVDSVTFPGDQTQYE